jgi:hypothetical protein
MELPANLAIAPRAGLWQGAASASISSNRPAGLMNRFFVSKHVILPSCMGPAMRLKCRGHCRDETTDEKAV